MGRRDWRITGYKGLDTSSDVKAVRYRDSRRECEDWLERHIGAARIDWHPRHQRVSVFLGGGRMR